MSEYDELLPEEPKVPYEPPEVVDLPALVTAADLLPQEDDPLASVPQEPPDQDTPPDDAFPAFLVRKNRFGPGAHSVLLADGTPVGVWLHEVHHDLSGEEVAFILLEMGLEPDLASWFGRIRDQRHEAEGTLRQNAAIVTAVVENEKRLGQKEQVRAAFLQAQKKKAKEGG